jgi:hypothetical protein
MHNYTCRYTRFLLELIVQKLASPTCEYGDTELMYRYFGQGLDRIRLAAVRGEKWRCCWADAGLVHWPHMQLSARTVRTQDFYLPCLARLGQQSASRIHSPPRVRMT